MIDKTKFVLVTGGNGFLAGHLIQQLLMHGYRVRATVRNESQNSISTNVQLLPYISDTLKNLEILEIDLMNSHSAWEKAFMDGVEYVFHLASPYILCSQNPEVELMNPAVSGTRKILELCQSTLSVKKLILTSCMCAVADEFLNGKEYTEFDWNLTSSIAKNSYSFSKTSAERLAFSFASRPGCSFKLATVLPFVMLGPHLSPGRSSLSHRFLLWLLADKTLSLYPNLSYCISDVRDVAAAHIVAMESERALGRHCLCSPAMPLSEVLQTVHEAFGGELRVPTRQARDFIVRMAASRDASPRGEFVLNNLGRGVFISCYFFCHLFAYRTSALNQL
jgi:dihydroflavonol-4-reductase